jgi:hypothetical protein
MSTYPKRKHFNPTPQRASGGSGITNSAELNEIAKSDGTNIVGTGVYKTADGLINRSLSAPATIEIFFAESAYSVPNGTLAAAHPCELVSNGANNSTYFVEATLVAMDEGGSTGGAIKIAGVFKKDGAGIITQIGATQTLMAAVEDIAGALTAAFAISGGGGTDLQVNSGTAGVDCKTICHFKVVAIDNA